MPGGDIPAVSESPKQKILLGRLLVLNFFGGVMARVLPSDVVVQIKIPPTNKAARGAIYNAAFRSDGIQQRWKNLLNEYGVAATTGTVIVKRNEVLLCKSSNQTKEIGERKKYCSTKNRHVLGLWKTSHRYSGFKSNLALFASITEKDTVTTTQSGYKCRKYY